MDRATNGALDHTVLSGWLMDDQRPGVGHSMIFFVFCCGAAVQRWPRDQDRVDLNR
jgi:hypothetical protein